MIQEFVSVKSSSRANGIAYDAQAQALYVRFAPSNRYDESPTIWRYSPVVLNEAEYEALCSGAASIGKFVVALKKDPMILQERVSASEAAA